MNITSISRAPFNKIIKNIFPNMILQRIKDREVHAISLAPFNKKDAELYNPTTIIFLYKLPMSSRKYGNIKFFRAYSFPSP